MNAQMLLMLKESLVLVFIVGKEVLRLKRNAWSMVKLLQKYILPK